MVLCYDNDNSVMILPENAQKPQRRFPMERLQSFIDKYQDRITPRFILTRLACAYFICLTFCLYRIDIRLTDFSFFQNVSLPLLLGAILLIFAFLCFVENDLPVSILTVGVGTLYCYLAICDKREYSLLFGCIALMAFLIFFTNLLQYRLTLPKWMMIASLIALFSVVTLGVGFVCVLHYNNNNTSCFDFGIFAQMFYNMKETGLPVTTCERDGLLSHFAVHVSPIYYLLLPIYFLFPNPRTLLIMQCVVTFSGLIPLYFLCRRYKLSNLAIVGFSACYVLYPSFTGASYYYLHENNFLPPLILWMLLCLEWESDIARSQKEALIKKVLCFVSTFLVLFVKEDAPVYAAVIGLYFTVRVCRKAFSKKSFRDLITDPAPWIFLISVIYFMVVVTLLSTKGDGAMTGRYDNYIYDGSGSLAVMLIGIVKNPIYVITQCASPEKFLFLAYMLFPLGLLPLLSKKIENWILIIPLILFNLMSTYGYQYNIRFQYAFGSGVLLIFLAVKNYSELKPTFRMKILGTAVISAVLIYGFHFGESFRYFNSYNSVQNLEYRSIMEEAALYMPEDASLSASTFLVPVFSQRPEIYELETTSHIPEYYAVDLRGGSAASEPFESDPATYNRVYFKENKIAIYQYIDWVPGLLSTKDAFCALAYMIQEQLELNLPDMLASTAVEEIASITVGDVDVVRVTEDQHWTTPTEDGSTQAVFIVDKDGKLIYVSLKDGEYVTTWSGPTKDEHYATPSGGWSNGNGAGWTGTAHK